MMVGPNMPPRLATELIRAMPPAAAGPLRKVGGSVQNVGNMHFVPVSVRAAPATKSQRESRPGVANRPEAKRAIINHPVAPVNAEQATCQRRSPVLSEFLPTRTMPVIAITLGAAAKRP